jgi:N-acetylmuramic acid 6-phosphate (MurNAc-6-P) etherase
MSKSKSDTNLVHGMNVDIAFINKLVPAINAYDGQVTEQIKEIFEAVNSACDSLKAATETIKSWIPKV